MSARRCSTCALNWPDEYPAYKLCPQCDGSTDQVNNATAMSQSQANAVAFEAFYEKREAARMAQMADLEKAVEATPSLPDPEDSPAESA